MKARPPKKAPAQPVALPLLQRLDQQLVGLGWRLLLGLGLLAFLLAAWTFDPKLALSGDNTEFMTLARSLVQGQGLSYISLPEPKPATKYPFGFPLMLAPLQWLAPGNYAAMNWLVVLFFAGSIPLVYLLARDEWGRLPALLVALWSTTLPALLDYSHQVMSEIPYLLFSLLALWLITRSLKHPQLRGNYWFIGGFACLMWAYYLRGVGLVLVVAVFLYLLLSRHYRHALILGGGAFLLALPWSLRNRALGDEGSYFKQLLMVNPYYPERGTLDLVGLLARIKENSGVYLAYIVPDMFLPVGDSPGTILNLCSVILLATAIWAVAICFRQQRHLLLLLYATLYLGTVLVWPEQWAADRFLVPIVPVLLFFVVLVGAALYQWLAQRGLGAVGKGSLGGALVLVLTFNLARSSKLDQAGEADYRPAWKNYYEAGLWLKANTPREAVISCRKDYWLYIVADRPCMVYPFKEPEEVIASLEEQGVDYVVVDQLVQEGYNSTPKFLIPAIEKYPERFELAWEQPGSYTFIFRFLPKSWIQ